MGFFKITVLMFLTRKSSVMKTHIVHQGVSYTSSFFQLDEITFTVVAECSDDVFSNPVYKEERAEHGTVWDDVAGQYTQLKWEYSKR